jgi:hypothetical protein
VQGEGTCCGAEGQAGHEEEDGKHGWRGIAVFLLLLFLLLLRAPLVSADLDGLDVRMESERDGEDQPLRSRGNEGGSPGKP